ncbi:MAG: serine protease [bacterium]|nr:serine protease [bacterium]
MLLVAMGLANLGQADDPAISSLMPPGFQSGTEVELRIVGARLQDATQLLLYEAGVEVLELKPEEKEVKVKLRIDEHCRPGLHAMRLASETGISNLRFFGVSPLPHVTEEEPNSDFATPQTLKMNTTVSGVIQTEDVDYYAVELQAGEKLTVELEGLRLGTEFFDPFVAILDAQRFELTRSDDAPLLQQDCVCSYVAKESGRYWIEVRESSFGGNDRCQYRLHVGDFPRPLAIMPAGGRPGEVLQATIVDASGETWTDTIELPQQAGDFAFVASRAGKQAPSPNLLRVVELPNAMANEPDDDRASLPVLDVPVALNGVLEESGDVDWFRIRCQKDQTLKFQVFGRNTLRSPIDSILEIHKASGGRLADNDDAGGPDSAQDFKVPEDGEYLVAIRDQLLEGSPLHAYRVEIAPPAKSLALTVDELQRYISQTVEVPQGSQMAVLLRARRSGFGGELNLRLEGAPAGLELKTPVIAANQSFIPMLVKADDDAQPGATLATLVAETLPDGAGVVGSLEQRTMLVRGQNNRDMWGHNSDKLAIAVTKKLPFSIEVEQPQVPLVRNGSTEYVVRAKRDEGYKETIYLRALYNPSGCGASGSVSINPDQNEARILITANDKAALGTFPITILARAKSRDAAVWVASEFINLEVADSFFEFQFGKTVAELGASASVSVGVKAKRPVEGDVELELVGLPAGVTCPQPKLPWSEEQQQVAFPVQIAADARDGQFKTLYVRATITRPEGSILQTAGGGEIQLTKPAPASVAVAVAPKPSPSQSQPLNRLDQLRQAKRSNEEGSRE